MEDRATTTSATTALHGGMQLGNNNSTIYRNCTFNYITNNCKQCHPAEEHVVSEDTSRDLIPSSSVHTTTSMRLVDSEGRELELGDIVVDTKHNIYAGDGMIIGLDTKTRKIVLEPINVEEPFESFSTQILIPNYSPMQIVQRAKGKVGQKYDDIPIDFVFWCYIDMTLEETRTGQDLLEDSRAIQKLRRKVEKAKRALSSQHQTRMEIESLTGGHDFSQVLTRAKLEELNTSALDGAYLNKTDIDEIIMVGVSREIPKIQQLVKEFLDREEPNRGINPEDVVAYGAAVQGGVMPGNGDNDIILYCDFTPFSLGIETI